MKPGARIGGEPDGEHGLKDPGNLLVPDFARTSRETQLFRAINREGWFRYDNGFNWNIFELDPSVEELGARFCPTRQLVLDQWRVLIHMASIMVGTGIGLFLALAGYANIHPAWAALIGAVLVGAMVWRVMRSLNWQVDYRELKVVDLPTGFLPPAWRYLIKHITEKFPEASFSVYTPINKNIPRAQRVKHSFLFLSFGEDQFNIFLLSDSRARHGLSSL